MSDNSPHFNELHYILQQLRATINSPDKPANVALMDFMGVFYDQSIVGSQVAGTREDFMEGCVQLLDTIAEYIYVLQDMQDELPKTLEKATA